MQQAMHLSVAESLSGIWSALHRDADFAVSGSEIHYLRMLAVTLDDDQASSLLLKKLKLATPREPSDLPPELVRMNSFLEFAFDGGPARFGQLVHPSPQAPSYGVDVTSLLGIGLLGLRAGQTILWPDSGGSLCDLEVGRVENCPGMTDWLNGHVGRE